MNNQSAEIIPYENLNYPKSNFLISAKYKSTLLENQILALALTHIKEDEQGGIFSEITAQEVMKKLNKKNGSFYDQLFNCAEDLTNRQIIMEDKDNHQFRILNVIQTAEYGNGLFRIKYNYDIKKYLIGLQQNFTYLNISVLMNFKSVYSFRLYELLKSKSYYPKGIRREENLFRISYSLSELKLDLGAVNSSYDRVQRILRGSNPDFDKAVQVANEKTFERWSNFKARVLDPSIKEINDNPEAEMNISYETGKSGKGGKIHEVSFTVKLCPMEENCIKEEKQKDCKPDMAIIEKADELLKKEKVSFSDLKSIVIEADNEIEKIVKAYKVYKNKKIKPSNFTGFMIMAIRNDYDEKSVYNFDMMTNNYDFEELEKEIVANV